MNPLLLPAAIAALAMAYLFRRRRPTALGAAPVASSPNARLLQAALELLPDKGSVLSPPSPVWDAVLGGRIGDSYGAPSWGYFATYIGVLPDGTKRKGGTTCEIFMTCCAGKAGWPRSWINRRPDDPMAPGDGFTPGMSKAKIEAGARAAGWLRVVNSAPASSASAGPALMAGATGATGMGAAAKARDVSAHDPGDYGHLDGVRVWHDADDYAGACDDALGAAAGSSAPPALDPKAPDALLAGDYYCTLRPGATYNGHPVDGSHVGAVAIVEPPNEKGERVVWTIDGGQTCSCQDGPCQCAKWNRRVLRPDGWLVGPTGVAARLVWVIRAPVTF